ncbi:MAG: prepilin peptidase [Legionella sp.]|jgi:leader peptidase (prepilin peptidase)/N-methyltransferase|nr:prepilin peptidase [Legionella sp.]
MYYLGEFIARYPTAGYVCLGLLTLLVGSFLNVVIYRLPRMLEHTWKNECRALLNPTYSIPSNTPKFNLCFPRSTCPSCDQVIPAWHNIPILSFIILRGRCCFCKQPISWQYPWVELTCLVLSVFAAYHMGFLLILIYSLVFIWILICMTVIDLKHQILPDSLTLGLLWLGLLANLHGLITPLPDAVLGAACGYIILWLVMKIFYCITGKIGMGHGDFKLLAALGAWFGWIKLPLILLIASLFGAVVGMIYLKTTHQSKETPIPFGPFLCFSGIITLFWGEMILATYLRILF